MNPALICGLIAIASFLAAVAGVDNGKGVPIGLVFVTVLLLL
jgi:hypothetical protein